MITSLVAIAYLECREDSVVIITSSHFMFESATSQMSLLLVLLLLTFGPLWVRAECFYQHDDTSVKCHVTSSQEIQQFFANETKTLDSLVITGPIEVLNGTSIFGANSSISKLTLWTSSLRLIEPEIVGAVARQSIRTLEASFGADHNRMEESSLSPENIFNLINYLPHLNQTFLHLEPDALLGPRLCQHQELVSINITSSTSIGRLYLEAFTHCTQLEYVNIHDTHVKVVASDQRREDVVSGIYDDMLVSLTLSNCSLKSSSFQISQPPNYAFIYHLENNQIDDLRPLGHLAHYKLYYGDYNALYLEGNPINCSDPSLRSYAYKVFGPKQLIGAKCTDGTDLFDYKFACKLTTTNRLSEPLTYLFNHIDCTVSNISQVEQFFAFLALDKLYPIDRVRELRIKSTTLTSLDGDDIFGNIQITKFLYHLPLVTWISPRLFGYQTRQYLINFQPIDSEDQTSSMSAKDYFALFQHFPRLHEVGVVLKPNETLEANQCQAKLLRSITFQAKSIHSVDLGFIAGCPNIRQIKLAGIHIEQLRCDQAATTFARLDAFPTEPIEWNLTASGLTSDSFQLNNTPKSYRLLSYNLQHNNISSLRSLRKLLQLSQQICITQINLGDDNRPTDCDNVKLMQELVPYADCFSDGTSCWPLSNDVNLKERLLLISQMDKLTRQLEQLSKHVNEETNFLTSLGPIGTALEEMKRMDIYKVEAEYSEKMINTCAQLIDDLLGERQAWSKLSDQKDTFRKIAGFVRDLALVGNSRMSPALTAYNQSLKNVDYYWSFLVGSTDTQVVRVQTADKVTLSFAIADVSTVKLDNKNVVYVGLAVFKNTATLIDARVDENEFIELGKLVSLNFGRTYSRQNVNQKFVIEMPKTLDASNWCFRIQTEYSLKIWTALNKATNLGDGRASCTVEYTGTFALGQLSSSSAAVALQTATSLLVSTLYLLLSIWNHV